MNKRTYILVFLLLLAGFTSELSAQKKPKKAKQEISVVSGPVSYTHLTLPTTNFV